MSRNFGMNPTFNFTNADGVGYGHQTTHLQDANFQQWMFSGSGTVLQSLPSPTTTVHTAQTATFPRSIKRVCNQHRGRNVQHDNMDPSLQYLMPPTPRSLSAVRNSAEQIVHPISRLYHDDDPWNPLNPHQARHFNTNDGRNAFQYGQGNFDRYRQGPYSDFDKRSDSGYQTQPPPSVLSNEPRQISQELPLDIMLQTQGMNVNPAPNTAQAVVRMASDQRSVSQLSSRSGSHKQQYQCREKECGVVSKCASEYKKHMLKHEKNFVCDEPSCKRAGKGFSTINDLDRHRKSVHKIAIGKSKSYRCAAAGCTSKIKLWPRLDNFKQHIERMHKNEDVHELISRSEQSAQDPQHTPAKEPQHMPTNQQSLSLDTGLLAGMHNSHDSVSFSSSQGFSHQSSMTLQGSSSLSVSPISPSTAALDLSFSEFGEPFSIQDGMRALGEKSLTLSLGDQRHVSVGRRQSAMASPADTIPRLTKATGPAHDLRTISQLPLTSAPQTKSEQQRQALQKPPKSDMNIDDIMLRFLNAQQQQGTGRCDSFFALTDDERQALAEYLKQKKSKPVKSLTRQSTQGSTTSLYQCEYKDCTFSGRQCDLNKHTKRHAKPYGCTYPKCHKRFGAKSDWKRHEHSQHFQLEAFRCSERMKNSHERCVEHFHRPAQFEKHLRDKHSIFSEGQVQASLKRCRIGKNCQGQFWCGFCQKIQPLKEKRNAAWDERFDHIAHHYEKEAKHIDNWLCVEQNRTKKELRKDMDRDVFEDDEPDATYNQGFDIEELSAAHQATAAVTTQPPQERGQSRQPTSADAENRGQPREQMRQVLVWNCCECGNGPMNHIVQSLCIPCNHAYCEDCEASYVDPNL